MVGINKINFYTSNLKISMGELAQGNASTERYYTKSLGQNFSTIPSALDDIVSMACNAAYSILTKEDRENIEMVLFATESGIDSAKCGGLYCASLLNLPRNCRYVELKQACYAGTAAIIMAKHYLESTEGSKNPKAQVLVLCSDVAFYGFGDSGEPTQGCGAVAMLITNNPSIAIINNNSSYIGFNNYDFFRPNECSTPVCNGKYSVSSYLATLGEAFNAFSGKLGSFNAACFHLPFAAMQQRALQTITELGCSITNNIDSGFYTKNIGNIYNGSLFLALISTLNNASNIDGDILMFSYGSGSMGEIFTLTPVFLYQNHLIQNNLEYEIQTYEDYKKLWQTYLRIQSSENYINANLTLPHSKHRKFGLASITNYKRNYVFNQDGL